MNHFPKTSGGEEDQVFPLSFPQEQIWLQLQTSASPLIYNQASTLEFHGDVDVAVLEESVQLTIQRNQMLRTTIHEEDGNVFQRIHPYRRIPAEVVDFRSGCGRSKEKSAAKCRKYLLRNLLKEMDLTNGPLTTYYIIIMDEMVILQPVVHHILIDGTAGHILELQVRGTYHLLITRKPIPTLPGIQYSDYVVWERAGMADAKDRGEWWVKYLHNIQPLNIPRHGPTVPSVGEDADITGFVWSTDTKGLVAQLSTELKVTPFVVILSSLAVYLGRTTNSTDVSIVIAKHGRSNPKVKHIVGHFVNRCVVRVAIDSNDSFRELVSTVGVNLLSVYANAEYPFHYVLRDLDSGFPEHELFPVALIMTPEVAKSSGSQQFGNYLALDNGKAAAEIGVNIQPTKERFAGCVKYNPKSQTAVSIKQMMSGIEAIIVNALVHSQPDSPINHLDVKHESYSAILKGFSSGECVNVRKVSSLVELFHDRVKLSPFKTAVIEGTRGFSYDALNKEADSLAFTLSSMLRGNDTFVAILLPQSQPFIVATLAILKLGKTVVPLSTISAPKALLSMLSQIGNPLLISSACTVASVALAYPRTLFSNPVSTPNEHTVLNLGLKISGAAPYCLFTSGSTGTPKAVILSHSSITNHCEWVRNEFRITGRDRSLVFNNVSFDMSLHDIWPFLGCGGTLCIPPSDMRYWPVPQLWEWITNHRITSLLFPTSIFNNILSNSTESELKANHVRMLICGGETLQTWRSGLPFHVINGYGLTECTVMSTFCIQNELTFPTVGKPVWNTEIYVLDPSLKFPVLPIGVRGIIFIGGAGVSSYFKGDHNRCFTSVDFTPSLLFNTGDQGYWNAQGSLSIVGRVDNQIKIGGYRIQLGEIEKAVVQYPSIVGAAVKCSEGMDVMAYCKLESSGGDPPTLHSLQAFLRNRVPYYAVPSLIFIVNEFPLNGNGKIDKSCLDEFVCSQLTSSFSLPSTAEEKLVAKVWAKVLELPISQIGVDSNFFALRGNSLLVAQVCRSFHNMKAEDLFRNPTVREFAKIVKSDANNNDIEDCPSISSNGNSMDIPPPVSELSLQQEQVWFHMQDNSGLSALYNEACNFTFPGTLKQDKLRNSIQAVVSRHNVLESNFIEEDGKAYMRTSVSPKLFSIQHVDSRRVSSMLSKGIARALIISSHSEPFQIVKDTLFRFRTMQLSTAVARVQIVFHHLILDAVGLHIFEQELMSLYNSFPAVLKPLQLQYSQFVLSQRLEFTEADLMSRSSAYWKNRLSNLEVLNLFPQLRKNKSSLPGRCRSTGFEVSPFLTEQIKRVSAIFGTTAFVMLLSALKVLLYHYTGQEDIFVVSTSSARRNGNSDDLIGYFINMIIIRTVLNPAHTFMELADQIRRDQIDQLPHVHYPYQYVLRDSSLETIEHGLGRVCLTAEPRNPTTISQRSTFFFENYESDPKCELLIGFDESEDNFLIYFVYDSAIYSDAIIDGIQSRFANTLGSVCANPLEVIPSIVGVLNAPLELKGPSNELSNIVMPSLTLQEQFLQVIPHHCQSIAIRDGDSSITTYEELLALSKSLQSNIPINCHNQFVAVLLPQSTQFIGCCLGILMSGNICVPIDTDQPLLQIKYMLQNLGHPVLLTTRSICQSKSLDYPFLCLVDEEVGRCDYGNWKENPIPNVAYCLFTSGSTGRPKPVLLHQSGIMNCVNWMHGEFSIAESDQALLFSSPSSDMLLAEIWPTLLKGGTLHIPPPEIKYNVSDLHAWVKGKQITIVNVTTKVAEAFFNSAEETSALRHLFFGGEALGTHPKSALTYSVSNGYGPTESTMFCTVKHMSYPFSEIQTVGHPIPNTSVHILSSTGNVPPPGVVGEVYIGGIGVAQGYLNHPLMNNRKFISREIGLAYRTGDLGYFLSNGELMLVGRMDNQIKIRGYRIGLGVIEAALQELAGIQQSVVLMTHPNRLIAYCTGTATSDSTIRSFLKNRLPRNAIPTQFLFMDRFPLTPIGKLDKEALIAVGMSKMDTDPDKPDPLFTHEERVVRMVWAGVLHIEENRIGRSDNFFSLGGHSLLAGEVIAQLNRMDFNKTIAVYDLFTHSVLSDFANCLQIDEKDSEGRESMHETSNKSGLTKLSLQQEQIWLHMQANLEHTTLYNESFSMDIYAALNKAAISSSVRSLHDRQRILSSNYMELNGEAYMKISCARNYPLQFLDLRKLNSKLKFTLSARLIHSTSKIEYLVWKDNLLRFRTAQLSNQVTNVAIGFHHLIMDGSSIAIFAKEFPEYYKYHLSGSKDQIPPSLHLQYVDYATTCRSKVDTRNSSQFWADQVGGLEVLNLFPQGCPLVTKGSEGSTKVIQISPELTKKIQRFANTQRVTTYTILLSVLKVLLSRLCNQSDIFVLGTSDSRNELGFGTLIGHFVNMIIIRTKLCRSLSFQSLVQQINSSQSQTMAHRNYPLQYVVRDNEIDTDAVGLFKVGLTMNPLDLEAYSQIQISTLKNFKINLKYDLFVGFDEVGDNILISNAYSIPSNLFHSFLSHFHTMLAHAVECPSEDIRNLCLLTTHSQIVHPQPTQPDLKQRLALLWRKQANLTPENDAIYGAHDTVVGYASLLENSLKEVSYLRSLIPVGDPFVAILLPQSIQFLTSTLAVLMSNKVCVPLNVDYPAIELECMLQDLGCPYLITTSDIADTKGLNYNQIILIDNVKTNSAMGINIHNAEQESSSTAYCLFTSGSTGRPKAVLVNHYGLINIIQWMQDEFQISSQDKSLLICSPSFDVSLAEIWPALLKGGQLCIPPLEMRYDISELHAWVGQRHVTISNMTTKLGEMFLKLKMPPTTPYPLVNLICAGEILVINPPLATPYSVTNCYGPSECTIYSGVKHLENGFGGIPSIGNAFRNIRLYILCANAHYVPLGVLGEICIAGLGVTKGYLNRPLNNSTNFVRNATEGVYRTGDLGYWMTSSELMMVGRIDNQIKIRGQRIGLGRIEATCMEVSGIEQCVVVVENGDTLFAYCTGSSQPHDNVIRSYLQERLPRVAIPSRFYFVSSIPLTPIGKVDRDSLQAMKSLAPILSEEDPNEPILWSEREAIVRSIWGNVLGMPIASISRNDNFFSMGGHSLLAGEVVAGLNELSLVASVADLFMNARLCEFAKVIKEQNESGGHGMTRMSQHFDGYRSVRVSFQQEQIWMHMQGAPEDVSKYNESFSVNVKCFVDKRRIRKSLDLLQNRHSILRSNYSEQNGTAHMQTHAQSQKTIQIQAVDLRRCSLATQINIGLSLLSDSTQLPFTLAKDNLVRYRVLQISSKMANIQIAMHHIIMDGFGMRIFCEELYATTMAGIEGKYLLKTLEFQYSDFAIWHRQGLESATALRESRQFWRAQLEGLEKLNLFPQEQTGVATGGESELVSFELSAGMTERLNSFALAHQVTPYAVILAVIKVLLYQYTDQSDLFILSHFDSRHGTKFGNLIGHFINTVITRTRNVGGSSNFKELVDRVHGNQIQILGHRDYPLQYVVNDCGLEPTAVGLFQVGCTVMLGNNDVHSMIPNVAVREHKVNLKYDLTIACMEIGEQIRFRIAFRISENAFESVRVARELVANLEGLFFHALDSPLSELPQLFQISNSGEQSHITFCPPVEPSSDFAKFTLHDLFKNQEQETPNNIAIYSEMSNGTKSSLTYLELKGNASNLSFKIRNSLSEFDKFVAILLPSSPEFITSILAILMAGRTCVPLNPEYPAKELELILQDLGDPFLITTHPILSNNGLNYNQIISFDTTTPHCEEKVCIRSTNPTAYCLFTSGSTGRPKAVLVSHSGLINNFEYLQSEFNITPEDKSVVVCAPSYDVSVAEIWPILLSGGTLCIPPSELRYDVSELHTWVGVNGVTLYYPTTKVGEMFLRVPPTAEGDNYPLRHMICGGEVLLISPALSADFSVINGYGPCECTMYTSLKYLEKGFSGIASVGKASRHVGIHVLSTAFKFSPMGVVGEIYISGWGVTKGYLNRSLINSSKLIATPFGTMYRSGDMGYWGRSGDLMVVGRIDNQVKVRGQRIELGQVEYGILGFPSTRIERAVAVLEEKGTLIAYCVGKELPNFWDLTNYLFQTLPLPSIPSTFVFVAQIPLTANGKVDKAGLKSSRLKFGTQVLSSTFVQPSTTEELIVAEVWSSVLNIPGEQISLHDNFFMLGGNSLQLPHVVKRFQDPPHNFKMTVSDVFRYDTLERFARFLATESSK